MNRDYFNTPHQGNGRSGWDYGNTSGLVRDDVPRWSMRRAALFSILLGALGFWAVLS